MSVMINIDCRAAPLLAERLVCGSVVTGQVVAVDEENGERRWVLAARRVGRRAGGLAGRLLDGC